MSSEAVLINAFRSLQIVNIETTILKERGGEVVSL